MLTHNLQQHVKRTEITHLSPKLPDLQGSRTAVAQVWQLDHPMTHLQVENDGGWRRKWNGEREDDRKEAREGWK